MTEFSFRDLLKPGDASRLALQRELNRRRELWGNQPGFYYHGAGDFLLQHGQFYQGRVLPDDYEHLRGPLGSCFANALRAAHMNLALQYCEGVYGVEGNFTPHAWCVASDGGVVEVTFPTRPEELSGALSYRSRMAFLPPEYWGYWGTIFPELSFVDQHGATLGLPMMDRPNADYEYRTDQDLSQTPDFPLFKVPFDPTRKVLP